MGSKGVRKLNLGCGPYKQEGYVNIDKNPTFKPDIVRDLARGIPFDSDTFSEVMCSHFFEHLDPDTFVWLLGEIYRVLCRNGILHIVVPLGLTDSTDHRMVFLETSLDTFCRPETSDYYQVKFSWSLLTKRRSNDGAGRPTLEVRMKKI